MEKKHIFAGIALLLIALVMGGLIGNLVIPRAQEIASSDGYCPPIKGELNAFPDSAVSASSYCFVKDAHYIADAEKFEKLLERSINKSLIAQHVREFSKSPHLAGDHVTEVEMSDLIKKLFETYGFDAIEKISYKVFVSKPGTDDVGVRITGKAPLYQLIYESKPEVLPDDFPSELPQIPPFAAYSSGSSLTHKLLFVNAAETKDFETVVSAGFTQDLYIDGAACIVRLSPKIDPGHQVYNCQQKGCSAVLFYRPSNASRAIFGHFKDKYSAEIALNLTIAMKSRNTILPFYGDPSTPGIPSIDGVNRIDWNDLHIPVQMISIEDVMHLLTTEFFTASDIPKGFDVNIDHFNAATIGGELKDGLTANITANTVQEVKTITNVVGYIYGGAEPDREVLIGSQRDSFFTGATTAGLSSAVLLELARIFGAKRQQNPKWRPRRTIAFASWSGSDLGALGATEFVEDKLSEIRRKVVAYIDIGRCVSGSKLSASATPSLRPLVRQITEDLSDLWIDTNYTIEFPSAEKNTAPFQYTAGIPSLSLQFADLLDHPSLGREVVGSLLDTFELFSSSIDPDFNKTAQCALLFGRAIEQLTELPLLPLSVNETAIEVENGLSLLKKDATSSVAEILKNAAVLINATQNFQSQLQYTSQVTPLGLRTLNDHMVAVEKSLVSSKLPFNRYVVYGPSFDNQRQIVSLPTVNDDRSPDQQTEPFTDLLLLLRKAVHQLLF